MKRNVATVILLALIVIISAAAILLFRESPPAEVTTTTIQEQMTSITTVESTSTTQPPSIDKLTKWEKENGIRIMDGVSSSTIIKENEYWMYYTGAGIELATSSDGLNFVKSGVVVYNDPQGSDQEMVTNPTVFQLSDGRYRMIYEGSRLEEFFDEKKGVYRTTQTKRKLFSAISDDGKKWVKEDGERFWDYGDGKPDEIFTSVPEVVKLSDGRLRMYYTRGVSSATVISNDEGWTWTKETDLDLKRKVAIDLDIIQLDDGNYKLFFTTFADEFGIGEQWVISANSDDGINFIIDEGKLIEPSTTNGLITDPDVIKVDGGYRMYYGEFPEGGWNSNILSAFSSG